MSVEIEQNRNFVATVKKSFSLISCPSIGIRK